MFTELFVKNFQSLSEAKLKLGRINVIVGPSYLGKSAIVRAIHALTRNRFETNYMKQGTSHSKIILKEGETFVEYNRDSSSSYKWSGNPEPYTKIGRDVPQDIRSFLKMDEIIFDEDLMIDFNIQRQFDPAFIISLSGFEVAKVFGKLMNLDIVLASSREISKDIQQLNRKKDECLAIQEVSINYIQQHCSIELKNALLQEAIVFDSEAEELEKKSAELLSLLADLEYEDYKYKSFSQLMAFLDSQEIEKIEAPVQGLEDIIIGVIEEEEKQQLYSSILKINIPDFDLEKFNNLQDLLINIIQCNNVISLLESLFKEIELIDFDFISSFENLGQIISDGEILNNEFLLLKEEKTTNENDLLSKQKEFEEYIKENNICPITNQPFSEHCLNNLKEGFN